MNTVRSKVASALRTMRRIAVFGAVAALLLLLLDVVWLEDNPDGPRPVREDEESGARRVPAPR